MKPVILVTRKLPDAVEDRIRRDYDPILNLMTSSIPVTSSLNAQRR